MRTDRSEEYFQKALQVLVGGVNSPVRSFAGVGGGPIVMKYGRGATLYDYDNNAYTDYCLSWGALILGHAHRNVVLSAKKTLEKGTSFGTTTREEIDLAKHICGLVPSIDRVRFVNSGTEATMSAVRLARGFTQKDIVVKFDGGYHGHFDDFLARAGSGVAQLQASSSQGIPPSYMENTISLPYNDIDALKKTLSAKKDKIACVIIEPVAGNMGVIPGGLKFLQTLRDLTDEYGIVLIFDEVMTGFRAHPGGVQAELDIIPDMTCLGKIIGGGFPIGAYGGRKDIMACLAPLGGVYQAGTFSGNPVVMRAGLAGLRLLTKDFYRSLNKKCEDFAGDVNGFFKAEGIGAHLSHYGSMMSLRFRREPVLNYADAQAAAGGERYGRLFRHLLNAGIYWPPADLEAFFLSCMHTAKDLERLAGELKKFFLGPDA
ncbi:MAG TPA: glutamate-1-semialdehyde 2,1-aminomutase [Candidatus Omnitrophota bacterium]|nr:glutamate-1-semialdehyde 2,1-aminomutase [Candidatus Omnitrophota bacterium]